MWDVFGVQKRWYLKSDKIVLYMTGILHPAFRSWCSINVDNQQRWYYLRFAIAVTFKFGSFFPAFGRWFVSNDDDQQWWWFLRSSWALVLTSGLIFLSSRVWEYIINSNQEQRSYLRSDIMLPYIPGSFNPALGSRHLTSEDNRLYLCYLRFFIALLFTIGPLFPVS